MLKMGQNDLASILTCIWKVLEGLQPILQVPMWTTSELPGIPELDFVGLPSMRFSWRGRPALWPSCRTACHAVSSQLSSLTLDPTRTPQLPWDPSLRTKYLPTL
jgi:hypothetical protein